MGKSVCKPHSHAECYMKNSFLKPLPVKKLSRVFKKALGYFKI